VTVFPARAGRCQALVAITLARPQDSPKLFVRPDLSQAGGEQVTQAGSGRDGCPELGGGGGGGGRTVAGAGRRFPLASIRTVPAIPESIEAAAETAIQQESGSGMVGKIDAENGGATVRSGLCKPTDSEPRRQLTYCSYSSAWSGKAVTEIWNDSARSRSAGARKTNGKLLVS
jgi:hypothetical protein